MQCMCTHACTRIQKLIGIIRLFLNEHVLDDKEINEFLDNQKAYKLMEIINYFAPWVFIVRL